MTRICVLASLLVLAIAASSTPRAPGLNVVPRHLRFDVSHQFVAKLQDTDEPNLLLSRYLDGPESHFHPTLSLKAVPTAVYRPSSHEALQHARWRSIHRLESEPIQWVETQVLAPDVTDRHTLAQLARMAANAYQLPWKDNWYELDLSWNINASFPFGWDGDEDGFRGFVFRSRDNSTIVLSIKGTTLQGPTSKKDKLNDNLLFSCCCARIDFSRCDDPCLSAALVNDDLFYSAGVKLVNDLRFLFPHADIWLVGHSLGGSLASLLGATFGLPAVAYEAPGERMAAHRLHLPFPPSLPGRALPHIPTTHVYHNADPIPQGACSGIASLCVRAGYALETRCHLGQTIVYDTVTRLGWHVDVRKHPIKELVLNVLDLEVPWPDEQGKEREVPTPREEIDCIDCFKWEFGHFKHQT